MKIYCVIDTHDETFYHNIDAAFLSEEEAKGYLASRAYSWYEIQVIEISSFPTT